MPVPLLEPDMAFRAASAAVLPAWAVLVLMPPSARWAAAVRRWAGQVWPTVLSVLYVALLAAHWRGEGGFGSLAEVRALFAVPRALVAGWVHYLAFDLFVGGWIAGRAGAKGWPHLLVLPVYALRFLFGPAGLLAYALIAVLRRPVTSTQGDAR